MSTTQLLLTLVKHFVADGALFGDALLIAPPLDRLVGVLRDVEGAACRTFIVGRLMIIMKSIIDEVALSVTSGPSDHTVGSMPAAAVTRDWCNCAHNGTRLQGGDVWA